VRGGEPVRPLPGRVLSQLSQVVGEIVVADRDELGLGPGIEQAQRGPLQVRRRRHVSQHVLQARAFVEDLGEPGGVGVFLEH
jgi:hypothetical protein